MTDEEYNTSLLIEALLKYVMLLREELDEVIPIAARHGWKSSRFEEGVKQRKEIFALCAECGIRRTE